MDRKERINSPQVAMREALRGHQAQVWTAMPGILQSFSAIAGTCEVQPAIQAVMTDRDGKRTNVTLPMCVDVPVQFVGTAAFALTFPMQKGDEGLIVFASRCIDAWWQSGGVQPQAEMRMHDLSDGFFIPGLRSRANALSNINTTEPELRNADGSIKLSMTPLGFKVTGQLEVTGNLLLGGAIQSLPGATYAGAFMTTGAIIAGVGGADQVSLRTHTHPGNNTPPTPGT